MPSQFQQDLGNALGVLMYLAAEHPCRQDAQWEVVRIREQLVRNTNTTIPVVMVYQEPSKRQVEAAQQLVLEVAAWRPESLLVVKEQLVRILGETPTLAEVA